MLLHVIAAQNKPFNLIQGRVNRQQLHIQNNKGSLRHKNTVVSNLCNATSSFRK